MKFREFYMDVYRAPHNQFYLNENVVKKELLQWLWQTRKYVWEGSDQMEKSEQNQASGPWITYLSEWWTVTQTFSHAGKWWQHRTESGWSTPVQTINHIRENSSGEVCSMVFNFKRCHEKSHKLLLLTICTICSWWNVCVPTLYHFT